VARVKTRGNFGDIYDRDTGRQTVIQVAQNLRRSECFRLSADFEMRHLAHRVDAGIGASRALNLHVRPKQILHGQLQFALHGAGVDLLLPA